MNIDEIKQYIDKYEIISFDIFDTILSRRCYPDYTKYLFSKYIKELFNIKLSTKQIYKIRLDSEQELYEMNDKIYGDKEFNYKSLIEKMYYKLKDNNLNVPFDIFCDRCIFLETNIESKVLYANEDALETIEYAKEKGKKIICTSDMYLSKKMIESIFERKDLLKYFDDIFVSSEYFKSKKTGNLFKYVMDYYKKDNTSFLHIGDNEHSDYNIPTGMGIKSIRVIRNDINRYYESDKKDRNGNNNLKNLSYLTEDTNFDNEFKLYNFINKVYFEMMYENIDSINIENKIIKNKFKEYLRETFIDYKINFREDSEAYITYEDGTLKYKYNDYEEECTYDIKLSDMTLFRNILKNLQNYVNDFDNIYKRNNNVIKEPTKNTIQKYNNAGVKYSPLFYSFIDWILSDCKDKGIENVYFFTREGEFFYEIANRISKYDKIKKYILEVSRVATFTPSIREVTTKELMRVWNQYSTQSISSFCQTLDLDVDEFIDLFEKYDLNLFDKILYPFNDSRIKKLFSDKEFKKRLEKTIDNRKESILNYFKTKKLDNTSGKVAIVDIGWRGTIQDNLCYILPNKEIYGYYFGLNNFLNEQPSNAHKYGYLNSYSNGIKFLDNVTPIEMLCNSPYGSTIGYDENSKAIRKIDKYENQSYDRCVKYIQEGIINNISNLNDKEITDEEILNILNEIVLNPVKEVAEVYFNLKHNEEFGLGEYVNKNGKFSYKNLILAPVSSNYRNKFRESIINSTWNQGYLKINHLGFLNSHYQKKITNFNKFGKKKIAWFLPEVIKGSGGHRTIIQNANALVKAGYSCDLYFDEDYYSTSESMKKNLIEYFGECLCNVYIGSVLRDNYDLVFGTHAILTADYVKDCNCKNKAYFIQDFEPWFMPMGELYLSMERTYNYNFKGVSIGRWLAHKISTEYNTNMKYFNFCADLNVYKPLDNIEREDAVCFIYQPEKPRRCPNLGIQALKLVKKLRPEIKIYLYGSTADCNIECENLHIINIEKCNELYNKCRVGLCISSSNPSRIPFEMMASGLPVVDVYRENNLYDMPDEGVLLAESTPEALATAIIKIYDDKKLAEKMSKFGKKYMKDYSLEKGFEQFVEAVDSMFDGEYETDGDVSRTYNADVVTASDEVKNVSNIIALRPDCKNTSKTVRKLVKMKKNTKRKIKGIAKKLFRM